MIHYRTITNNTLTLEEILDAVPGPIETLMQVLINTDQQLQRSDDTPSYSSFKMIVDSCPHYLTSRGWLGFPSLRVGGMVGRELSDNTSSANYGGSRYSVQPEYDARISNGTQDLLRFIAASNGRSIPNRQ